MPNQSTLLATVNGVTQGQTVTVTGYSGSGNDVDWEIFATGIKLGQSTFHLSCSDWDMNRADDCGKLEGDGKLITASSALCGGQPCINDWIFEGMAGGGQVLDCGPCTGEIGDFAWVDTNQNGCQDANEPGLPGEVPAADPTACAGARQRRALRTRPGPQP